MIISRNLLIKSRHNLVFASRPFWGGWAPTQGDFTSEEEPVIIESTSVQNTPQESSSLIKTFSYIPIREHPLIPNFPLHYSISKEQFQMLKQGPDANTVCATVVRDQSKYMDSAEDLIKMLQGGEQGKILLPTLPKVKSFTEVHDFGTLCKIKYKENTGNSNSYTMMVIPFQRAKIVE